jgi:hypothetical protein
MAKQTDQTTYTRKASSKILKEVLKVNPKASGRTTFDQAFVILMTHWDMELSIETSGRNTVCGLWRDGEKIRSWDFKDAWDWKNGDWDFDTIYKTTLESILKEKLYKRPKLGKRAQKKYDEEKVARLKAEADKLLKEDKPKAIETPKVHIDDLRKKRNQLSMRISSWKKRGEDTSLLEKELNEIKEQIKKLK